MLLRVLMVMIMLWTTTSTMAQERYFPDGIFKRLQHEEDRVANDKFGDIYALLSLDKEGWVTGVDFSWEVDERIVKPEVSGIRH